MIFPNIKHLRTYKYVAIVMMLGKLMVNDSTTFVGRLLQLLIDFSYHKKLYSKNIFHVAMWLVDLVIVAPAAGG